MDSAPGCSMCVCDPKDRSTIVLDLVLASSSSSLSSSSSSSSSWTSAGDMSEDRKHFTLVTLEDTVYAVGSGQEGRVERFDEETEEWESVEQTLPTDIKLAAVVAPKDFVKS